MLSAPSPCSPPLLPSSRAHRTDQLGHLLRVVRRTQFYSRHKTPSPIAATGVVTNHRVAPLYLSSLPTPCFLQAVAVAIEPVLISPSPTLLCPAKTHRCNPCPTIQSFTGDPSIPDSFP
ncbi:hypothetical protein M0R45_008931 [Rubus argutus]|uniref:Uncharacterized protein n=1 Tax=Rubus argutus TaxID=59490 RepID=A0AAW1Y539_RUBAR